MITHSYIEASGSGHTIADMVNTFVTEIFDKLNKVVPFNRIYENPLKYDGRTVFIEKYELINGKILVFKVDVPTGFCTSSNFFNIYQYVTDVTGETEADLFQICGISQNISGCFTSYQDPDDYTWYYNISCTFLYTIINNENCNLFYMRNPSQEYYGFVGTYKIEDKIFCVAKAGDLTASSVIWDDDDDNKYYIAPLMNTGITTDKDDNFITMPVYLASNNIINTANPTLIYTDYIFKDWLLADSYHCIPKSTYTINGNDYYCHHFSASSGKYSLLIKI